MITSYRQQFNDPKKYEMRLPKVAQLPLHWQVEPFEAVAGVRLVDVNSKIADRRAAETLATYFKRELSYDIVQYSVSETYPKDCVLLFTYETYEKVQYAFGAVCMRWREYLDHDLEYAMAWVWFHPYERKQGHLSKLWPHLAERFGNFVCEGPLSPAMRAFLTKRGELHRLLGQIEEDD